MGVSGEQERSFDWRCNGQTLRWRALRLDAGKGHASGGIQQGAATEAPFGKMVL